MWLKGPFFANPNGGFSMARRTVQGVLCLIAAIFACCSHLSAQTHQDTIVSDSAVIIEEIMSIPARGIPISLFQKAEGIAFFPGIMKGGFILGVQHGEGTLVVKNGNGQWEYPRFVTLTGGSIGFQAGIQSADIILFFCSRRSIESALAGKFTIGADASVAAGPVGRQTSAATDYRFTSEIYSYSRSRGVFLGAALDGSVMEITGVGDYYKDGAPQSAQNLVRVITQYSTEQPENNVPQ